MVFTADLSMSQQNRNPLSLIQGSEKLASEFARKLLADCLKEMESRLLGLADAARTSEVQWQFLDASRQLKQKRAGVESAFLDELHQGFVLFQSGQLASPGSGREDTSPDLSLLGNEGQEIELAKNSFARRAETRYTEELFALDQRFSMLLGGHKITEDRNPVSPVCLAHCFQQGLCVLAAESKTSVLLYRVFEKIALPQLGKLYADINQLLIDAEILPHLRHNAAKQNMAQRSKATAPAALQPARYDSVQPRQVAITIPHPDPSLPAPQYQQDLYQAIRLLQQAMSVPVSMRSQELASTDELVLVIQNVQSAAADRADRLDNEPVIPCDTVHKPGLVMQRVQIEINRETGKDIAQDNASRIDLVGMMFEYMLGESDLPDNVKAVLSYLHTPFLKIAFIDQQLFVQADHPARQLLDALEETGSRWVNIDGTSQFKAFPKIKAVVRRVLTEFSSDMKLIEELLADIREFNEKVANNVSLLEQRAAQKAEGEDRLRQVKKQVNLSVRNCIDGKKVPAPLMVLLLHPWSEYLTFVLLRHGESSTDWKSGLELIDDLLWSIQSKETTEEQKRLVVMQDALKHALQQGFDSIAYDQVKADKLLEALDEMQLIALQNRTTQGAPAEVRQEIEATAVGQAEASEQEPLPATPAESEGLEKLHQMACGTWLDFAELDGQRNQRLKIGWFNDQASHYLLVNRAGKQAAILGAMDIARHLMSGNARVTSGTTKPFFDRAMEHIFSRLQRQLA
jgi:hypothetical protein